jgi:predicted acetyltransferase
VTVVEDVTVTDELPLTGIADGEQLAFARAVSRHFHEDDDDETLRPWLDDIDVERAFVVRDGDRIVANLGAYPVDLSVPGGALLPCAGITAVGVSQTHRRRGLLRRLMTRSLDDAVERGDAVAALWASESVIYPRFGYGVSAPTWWYRIDSRDVRFLDRVDDRLVREATPDEAVARFPAIYEQVRAVRPGGVGRTPSSWHLRLAVDPPSWRDGASSRRLVHVPDRGYASYRITGDERDALPAGRVRVTELMAVDAEAEQALWQHVTAIDLTTRVDVWPRPVDDPLPWLVEDRLRLHASDSAPLYTRLLDVPRCLASRTATMATGVTLHVHDADRDQTGTYRWDADPTGGACTRTDADPEVSLDAQTLAALWLGGSSATALRRARRVEEHVPGAVARLDALVASPTAPWTPWEF